MRRAQALLPRLLLLDSARVSLGASLQLLLPVDAQACKLNFVSLTLQYLTRISSSAPISAVFAPTLSSRLQPHSAFSPNAPKTSKRQRFSFNKLNVPVCVTLLSEHPVFFLIPCFFAIDVSGSSGSSGSTSPTGTSSASASSSSSASMSKLQYNSGGLVGVVSILAGALIGAGLVL